MERRSGSLDRRTQSFQSLVYGGLHPRRRTNRRPADDQRYLVDVYDAGLAMVAIAIVCMSCLDAFFTLNLLSMGAQEINYFMKVLIDQDASTFLIVKIGATTVGVVFLTMLARYRLARVLRVRRILETLCGIYACLIVWELYLLTVVAAAQLS